MFSLDLDGKGFQSSIDLHHRPHELNLSVGKLESDSATGLSLGSLPQKK